MIQRIPYDSGELIVEYLKWGGDQIDIISIVADMKTDISGLLSEKAKNFLREQILSD